MRYVEYSPSPGLAPLVERLWFLDGLGGGTPDVILPDGRIELVFHYAGACWRDEGRQPDAMVVGQMLGPVRLAMAAGSTGVAAIRLRPAASRAVLGFAAAEVTGRFVDLELVWPSARPLRDRLAEAGDDRARLALLESWLARRTNGRRTPAAAPAVAGVAGAIAASGGRAPIETLAARAGLHPRQLERVFLRDVGLTAKTFARISRLQQALRRVRAGAPLREAAAACGFYDQAHMARDFRQLTDMSPRAWQRHAGDLAPLFVEGAGGRARDEVRAASSASPSSQDGVAP